MPPIVNQAEIAASNDSDNKELQAAACEKMADYFHSLFVYPFASSIFAPDKVTIQIFPLTQSEDSMPIFAEDVGNLVGDISVKLDGNELYGIEVVNRSGRALDFHLRFFGFDYTIITLARFSLGNERQTLTISPVSLPSSPEAFPMSETAYLQLAVSSPSAEVANFLPKSMNYQVQYVCSFYAMTDIVKSIRSFVRTNCCGSTITIPRPSEIPSRLELNVSKLDETDVSTRKHCPTSRGGIVHLTGTLHGRVPMGPGSLCFS